MEVRHEDGAQLRVIELGGGDAHGRAAAGVDGEPFVAEVDDGAGAGMLGIRARKAGADEHDVYRGGGQTADSGQQTADKERGGGDQTAIRYPLSAVRTRSSS